MNDATAVREHKYAIIGNYNYTHTNTEIETCALSSLATTLWMRSHPAIESFRRNKHETCESHTHKHSRIEH